MFFILVQKMKNSIFLDASKYKRSSLLKHFIFNIFNFFFFILIRKNFFFKMHLISTFDLYINIIT